EEQIDPLKALINGILEEHPSESSHPLAAVPGHVDGEEVARQLDAVAHELKDARPTLGAIARLRERVSQLSDQAAWVADATSRKHLQDRAMQLLERLR